MGSVWECYPAIPDVQAMGGCESCASGRRKEVSRWYHWSRVGGETVKRFHGFLEVERLIDDAKLCPQL